MCSTRRTLAAALVLALAACGGKHNNEDPDGGSSTYALSLLGSANLVLHPNEKRTLQVILAQDQVGPVSAGSVHFEFQDGDPAGAVIDTPDVDTDENGIATVHFTAGKTSSGHPTYKLVASAPSYGPDPVAFSFQVIPVRRLLQIVASPNTRVAADGASATTTMGVSTSYALKVRELDTDTGSAISNDSISFSLPPAAVSNGNVYWQAGGATVKSTTVAGGEAQAFLFTKATPSGPWLVTVQSEAGGAAVTFQVTVQNSSGSSCTTNSQCPTGYICAGNPPTCQAGGGGTGCDNGSDNPCPYGYVCTGGVCVPPSGGGCDPAAPNCGSSQCCDGNTNTCKDICATPCAAGSHCQPGATCGTGTCVTDTTTPDVTGIWLTKHDYNIRQALPSTVQTVADVFRYLDQALHGKLTITGIGWIDDIINAIIAGALQQYLPDWLKTLIEIGDALFTVLSNLRAEGSMHLVKGIDYTHLNGSEVWTSLVFYWLPLCNGNIGGDPSVPPDCARIDIATTDAENPGEVGQCKGQSLPSITVQVAPFTATVTGTGAGGNAAPFTLTVKGAGAATRQVKIKMGKVILVLIDLIISLTTPYHCIDEITDCKPGPGNCPLLDCYGLGQDVGGTWVDPGVVEAACDAAVTAIGKTLTNVLANVWNPTADILDFDGHAVITDGTDASLCESGSAHCATKLGNDNWDKDLNSTNATTRANRDGAWNGDFFFKLISKLPGGWEAVRPE